MNTGDLVKLSPTVARRSRQDKAEEGVGTGLAGTRMPGWEAWFVLRGMGAMEGLKQGRDIIKALS